MTYTTDQLTKASFIEALDRLDAVRGSFTDRFLAGGVSVWAGSKISDTRYPDLGKLLTRLLDTLYDLSDDIHDPDDPERWTLDQILNRSGVPGGDPTVRFSDWPDALQEDVIEVLWDDYSAVLGTRYAPGSLLWDVLRIDEIYDDPAVDPDAEHRFLALLILEGVLGSLVTTNWDPLIEDAYKQAAGHLTTPALKTIVRPADIGGTGGQPVLTKMHGCARTAKHDPDAREYVVATEYQVKAWPTPNAMPLKEAVTLTARAYRVLYLGLSGQDLNIQQQHIQAGLFADYAADGPRVVFAHGDLEERRDDILEAVYGPETYHHQDNYDAIRSSALVPLFAKPLLGALYAFVLREKLRTFAQGYPDPKLRLLAVRGVEALVQLTATLVDAVPASATSRPEVRRWRFLSKEGAQFVSSFVRLYHKGEAVGGPWEYHALTKEGSPDTRPSDYSLALLIGILMEGHEQKRWTLSLVPDRPEQLTIHTPLREEVPVFVACAHMMSAGPLNLTIPDRHSPHLILVAQGRDVGKRGAANPSVPRLRLDLLNRIEIYLDDLIEQADPVAALHNELIKKSLAKPLPATP